MKNRRKKILFLITKSNWGGAQRYVYDLATSLNQKDFDVSVALGGSGKLSEKLKKSGITVHHIKSLQRDVSVFQEIASFIAIAKLLLTIRPDVFHINSSKAGGLGALLGRLLLIPHVIFTAHGWAFNEGRPNWQKYIIKFFHWFTVLLAHQSIAVSHTVQKQMNWPGTQRKLTVIHNGRKPILFLEKTEARKVLISFLPDFSDDGDVLWTGTIGELHPVKQHHIMIGAVENLVDQGQKIIHFIIGDGELENELKSLVKEKKLEKQVFFTGNVPEAAQYLKAFDIYVQPSRSEAFAYTIIEATQAGLPIIASRVGGMPEIISHKQNGLLVPAGDVTVLIDSLQDLILHPDMRHSFSEEAKKTGANFTLDKMVEKTLAVYLLK